MTSEDYVRPPPSHGSSRLLQLRYRWASLLKFLNAIRVHRPCLDRQQSRARQSSALFAGSGRKEAKNRPTRRGILGAVDTPGRPTRSSAHDQRAFRTRAGVVRRREGGLGALALPGRADANSPPSHGLRGVCVCSRELGTQAPISSLGLRASLMILRTTVANCLGSGPLL